MQDVLEPQSTSSGPRFGLTAAVGASLLAHLLLVVLGSWLLAVRPRTPEPNREKEALRIAFAPEPKTDTPPLEMSGPPPRPAEASRPVPPVPPVLAGAPTATDRRTEPSAERPVAQPAPERSGGSASDEGRADAVPRTSKPEDRGRPALDLHRALREFGETLDRSGPAARRGTGTSTFVPDAGQFPTTGYGMGNLSFETRDFDWSDYGRQIYIAIWRAWHNRLYQTVDDFEKWAYANGWFLNHENRIRFVIESSGRVSGIVVENGSGCDPLDVSATQALAEVILPPLPEGFPKQREVVRARFLAEGSIQEMRPGLTRLKQYGLF